MQTRRVSTDSLASRFRGRDLVRNLQRMHGSERFMQEGGASPAEYPAVNVWQDADGAMLTAELPGVSPDDLDISVVHNTLTLRGARTPPELKEGEAYHRQERWHGRFVRSLELPFGVDSAKVEAGFEDGVLSIKVPRAEEDKPKKIAIQAPGSV